MFRFISSYKRITVVVLLLVGFALTTKGCTNWGNKKENRQTELSSPVKQEQEERNKTLLTAQRQKKIALVIGNGAYPEHRLSNPVNDATDVARALRDLGFNVILRKDLKLEAMEDALENFSHQLHQGAVGVFYYAGHGVQVNGQNYLIPVDAQLKRERNVRRETIFLSDVLESMQKAETQVNIIIIDACRDNPFLRRWYSTRGSSVRGLSEVDSPPQGTIIAFATGPGEFAEDGEGQRNSPFTLSLLKHLNIPNLEVVMMFRQVRIDVVQETNEKQRPWYRESLVGSFFFNPKQEQLTSLTPQPSSKQITTLPESKPESSKPTNQPETILISKTTGVNYTQLRNLLEERKWKEADQKTFDLMLKIVNQGVAHQRKTDWLGSGLIENFPCEDLSIIDRLWVYYSQGKFGFSVQKELYVGVKGKLGYGGIWTDEDVQNYRRFSIMVGWKIGSPYSDNGFLDYNDLTFNLSAKKGHLPSRPSAGVYRTGWMFGLGQKIFVGGSGAYGGGHAVNSSISQMIVKCNI